MLRASVFFCSVLLLAWTSNAAETLKFPKGFLFGAASASYQVEGAWNVSDKSANIFDNFLHDNPTVTIDGSSGDVACDSYHLWKEDVAIAKELGLHFYRFSISWSRLLPSGFSNRISEDGARYYNNLIDELLRNGIQPMVTLYHWDLPQRLQNLGGWTNPLIADWFEDYARVSYKLFGDRVKYWITLNEPVVYCAFGYGLNYFPPAINDLEKGYYLCIKNSLLAHAKAYRAYDQDFRHFNGKVSLANHHMWYEPKSEKEIELTELSFEYANGLYSHPIFAKEGGWPSKIERYMSEKSNAEGHATSRLPAFTKEELELVKGTYDYYAFNHYTSRQVTKATPDAQGTFFFYGAPELEANFDMNPEWPTTASNWFRENPKGLRHVLNWIKQSYGDMEIMITENGFSTSHFEDQHQDEVADERRINYYRTYLAEPNPDNGKGTKKQSYGDMEIMITENGFSTSHFEGQHQDEKADERRINYYRTYLAEVLKAIKEDGVNVVGYTAWTMLDNFEWMDGYTSKFGLYHVDFTSPLRTRRPRPSAKFYAQLIKDNAHRDEL